MFEFEEKDLVKANIPPLENLLSDRYDEAGLTSFKFIIATDSESMIMGLPPSQIMPVVFDYEGVTYAMNASLCCVAVTARTGAASIVEMEFIPSMGLRLVRFNY